LLTVRVESCEGLNIVRDNKNKSVLSGRPLGPNRLCEWSGAHGAVKPKQTPTVFV